MCDIMFIQNPRKLSHEIYYQLLKTEFALNEDSKGWVRVTYQMSKQCKVNIEM